MSFEVTRWDGLAKAGEYTINGRRMETPALFPVVHPTYQEIPTKELKTRFGFEQLITSTYLLSKKFSEEELPDIHEHLGTDAIIMMDSGAYQLMVYGDVELDPRSTMEYQKRVGTDIGVIMDHPIGYDVPHAEARRRVQTTVERVFESIEYMDDKTAWTLPIQGGKYIPLIRDYLDRVLVPEVLERYRFFALGSVVQVMIKQDYETMVRMILETRRKLPVTYPLHLFGAGHPAMFALATYLGCDTFDSAAYSLMAKDGRYMTTSGTYLLDELPEFPCVCPVCSTVTPKELRDSDERTRLLSEHNLWVSVQEIRTIRNAIRRGDLRDLVTTRMGAVPGLARATKLAFRLLKEEGLRERWVAGTPVSKPYALRISSVHDLDKPEIIALRERTRLRLNSSSAILLFLDWRRSMYKRVPDELLRRFSRRQIDTTIVVSPLFGLIPLGSNEFFPLSQYTTDLDLEETPGERLRDDLDTLKKEGVKSVTAIVQEGWDTGVITELLDDFNLTVVRTQKVVAALKELFSEQEGETPRN